MAFNWNSPEKKENNPKVAEIATEGTSVTIDAEIIRIKTMADKSVRAEICFGEIHNPATIALLFTLIKKAIKLTIEDRG